LVVHARFLSRPVTGVERYAGEINRRLPPEFRRAQPLNAVQGWAGHLWEQSALPREVGQDRLWSPANSGPLAVTRQAVTIHDLAVLEHPEWFAPGFALWYRLLMPGLVRRVRAVLTVSQHSRARLAHRFGLDPDRVTVIPGGVDPDRFHPLGASELAGMRARLGLPERYLLFIGSREPRKNLPRLLAAWECVSQACPGLALVICGGAGGQFAPAGGETARQDVRWMGYATEADLAALYAGATAFIYPSLDEGFGLPVLEAMACGTPVIATTAGAVPEVAGPAALYADPLRVDDLAQAITRVLAERDLRAELHRRGLERAAGFSWEAAAQAVCQALEGLS
jgi:glycosyltransferase involved in cell wall biosynthesis